jgi:hypothetical protein
MFDRSPIICAPMLLVALAAIGGAVFLAAPASADPAVVVNGTRTAMVNLQIKEAHAQDWTSDVLGRRPLGVQKETTFNRDHNACVFDVKAMFEDGHKITKRVDLCKSPRFVLADF